MFWYLFRKLQKGKSNYSLKVISVLTSAHLDVGEKKAKYPVNPVSFWDHKQM